VQVRTLQRSLAGCVAVVASALVVGCSSSFEAQTNQIYQPAIGSDNRLGDVYVLDALVVSDGTSLGTVAAGLVNEVVRRGDALIRVTADSTDGNRVQGMIRGDQVRLPSQQLVQLADTGDVTLNAAKPLDIGGSITVTFTFRNAAPVTLDLPIVKNTGDFAHVPVPTPSVVTPTPRDKPTASPTP
jgi:copper(I)-binding protein